MLVCGLLRFKKVTNLRTNGSPQIAFAKFVVLVDWQKPHETKILLWPRGRCEDILGRSEDQLGTPASGTPDTKIVKVGGPPLLLRYLGWATVGLELRDIIQRGLD